MVDEGAVTQAIANAPAVVRDYIEEGRLADAVVSLAKPYNLHIDIIGTLAELARNMLIGVSSPAEVVGELVMTGIDSETAKKILGDLNEQIFIPIREEIRNPKPKIEEEKNEVLASNVPGIPESSYPAVIQESVQAMSPVESAVPLAPPSPAPIPQRIAHPVTAYTPTVPAAPVAQPVAPQVAAAPLPPPQVAPPQMPPPAPITAPVAEPAAAYDIDHPAMRTMASDMQMVKEHPAPALPFLPRLQTSAPAASSPMQPPHVVSAPPMPARAPNAAPAMPQIQRPAPPAPANLPGAPMIKEYGTDPYREPVE